MFLFFKKKMLNREKRGSSQYSSYANYAVLLMVPGTLCSFNDLLRTVMHPGYFVPVRLGWVRRVFAQLP